MTFLGHTRFSVDFFKSNNFAATRREISKKEYLNWLYDPERLKPRLEVFCEESLPQIAAAADGFDVTHIVSYSPSLPGYAQDALREASRQYNFVYLNETSGQIGSYLPSANIARDALGWTQGKRVRVGLYRLDDDDLLPSDYFARMAPYLEIANVGWRVSFANGFTAVRSKGSYYFARENYQAMVALGLLAVAEISEDGQIDGARDYSHTRTDRHHPVILDSRAPGFFRSRHRTQDNMIGTHSAAYPVEIFEQLRRYPKANVHRIQESFPVLKGKLFETLEDPNECVNILSSPITVTRAPVPFFLPFRAGASLHLRLSEGQELKPNSLIIRLRLREEGGGPPELPNAHKQLASVHVRHSPENGFYIPVWHGEKGVDRHCLIKMPNGIELLGAEIVAGNKGPVKLESLNAYPLPSDDAARPSPAS